MKVFALRADRCPLAAIAAAFIFAFAAFAQIPQPKPDQRPLNMLVLGDSVSWGQGLKDEHKAWYLVKKWLEQTTGREVFEHVEAHSGALVGSPKDKHDHDSSTVDGELSRAFPTVNDQIDHALQAFASPAQIDLVLVDGCINDVDSGRLLNAANTSAETRRLTRAKCGPPVEALLARIARTFPNAHVVVTGYYPIVSEKTANDLFMRALAKRFYHPEDDAPRMNDKMLRARLIAISTEWYDTSTAMLSEAARTVDSQLAAKGSRQRVLFANVPFRPEHAFAAKQSRFWGFDASALRKFLIGLSFGHVSLRSNDERNSQRGELCEHEFKRAPDETKEQEQTRKDRLMRCRLAAVAHPNRKGAAMYADAIGNQLKLIMAEPGWLRSSPTATSTPNPF
jgi:lysophospholipase L1-like esterase